MAFAAANQSTEQIVHALTRGSPVGAFISGTDGACRYVNRRWCELAGLDEPDALGDGWARALHPEDREAVVAEWETAGREGRETVLEYRFLRPDGTTVWVQGFAAPLYDDDGQLIGWAGSCIDVSARHRRERQQALLVEFGLAALRLGEPDALLANAVETVSAGLDADFASYLELMPDGLLRLEAGSGWTGLDTMVFAATPESPAGRALQTDGPVLVEASEDSPHALRSQHGVRCSAAVTVGASSKPIGVLSAHSQRVGAFEESDLLFVKAVANALSAALLREHAVSSTRQLAAIVGSSDDAIVSRSLDGTVWTWNAAAERLFGYPADEMIGTSVARLYPAGRLANWAELNAKLGQGEQLTGVELTCIGKDGSPIDIELTVSPIVTDDGDIRGVSTIARDIRERRRLEEELRQAQKLDALGRLAGGIAHDFNNILTAILGHARLASTTAAAAHEHIGAITQSAEYAAALTRQLLAYSRKQILSPEIVDLNDVVRSAHVLLNRLIEESIEIELRLAPQLPPVELDPAQLIQVLTNLVVNARDAMPAGGTIVIETAAAGDHVRVSVTDTGSGMNAETRRRAFEPFYTTKPAGSGTGLGLSTVYGIIKQSRGQIALASEEHVGTTVTMHFPAVEETPHVPSAATADAEPATTRRRVLLVEDNDDVRKVVSLMLQHTGHTITSVGNGEAALEILRDDAAFDVVVSDVVMPGIGGIELARHTRREYPHLRLIMTTGFSDEALDVLLDDEAIHVLLKPFTHEQLLQLIELATAHP